MRQLIPIQNIYYLFCYAWDLFPEGKAIAVGKTESPRILDLFASILLRGINRLKRRGLDRGYAEVEEELAAIRGRILVGETLRRNLLMFGRASCRFDNLRYDILHNQILKATLVRLSEAEELDNVLRNELRASVKLFSEVSDIGITNSVFRRVQLSRNNRAYDLLLKICELVHSALLPDPSGSGSKFSDILEDENQMDNVFEAFVRNFFRAEQTEFPSVKAEWIQWDAEIVDANGAQYLPAMHTDITLRSKSRIIIIDTKYYREALVENKYGDRKVRSDHLYQLFSYLQNVKSTPGKCLAEGILLYPLFHSLWI
jgi:5-methylcytosine-specific restriction enzyme subunit McrC